jgi:hypothetical protein
MIKYLMDAMTRQQEAKVHTVEMLEGNYSRLGKPPFDHKSGSFWSFMEILVDTWRIGYPMEVLEWLETREMDLANEKTLKEQVAGSGLHKSFAIPSGLFRMIKAYWPDCEIVDKEFGAKFKKRFPIFRNSNYT